MRSLKYVAIIVFYYQAYFENTSSRFKKMIASNCNGDVLTVAVNNNPSNIKFVGGFDIVLNGEDTFSEFYAWELAIRHIRNEDYQLEDVVFIMANDTFCEHRLYSWFHEKIFFQSVEKGRLLKRPIMIGEVNRMNTSFCILGLRSDCWVSTYLFSFNYALLSKMHNITLSINKFNTCLNIEADGNINWTDNVSFNLKNHINNWINEKWYKKDFVKKDLGLKRWKLHSILNEKYLSAFCIQNGGIIEDPYRRNIFIYYFLRVLNKIHLYFRI